MKAGKNDCEKLFEEAIPLAKKMLSQYAEFHPYAVLSWRDKDYEHVAIVIDGEPYGFGERRVRELWKKIGNFKREEGFLCSALVINLGNVKNPQTGAVNDCIQVCLRHTEGYSIDVFLPYSLDSGAEPVYGSIFAHFVHGQ